MKKLALSAIALTALCTAFVAPSHASPLPDGPVGQKCTFNSATDVNAEAGHQVAVVKAGPLVTAEAGTLKCTVHVGNDLHSGAGTLLAGPTAATAGAVVVIPPTVASYAATAADDPIALCTEWDPVTGPPLYWVSVPAPGTGFWTTNTDGQAHCGVALSIEPNDPECSIWLAIDKRAGTPIAETWQDCEGYQPII
jgi:hypothetical protein